MTETAKQTERLQPPRPGQGGVKDQAEAWLAYLYSGTATDAGRRRFSHWLRESPAHAAAYAGAEQLWRDLGLAADATDTIGDAVGRGYGTARSNRAATPFARPDTQAASAAPRRRLRAAFASAATLLLAVAVGWFLFYDPDTTRYTTAVGEIETITLADGSQVTLSGASTIVAHITEQARRVELTEGRAYFDVAADEQRDFRVRAAATEIRVVGTQFDVNKSPDGVRVSVTEGRVEIADAASTPAEEPVVDTAESAHRPQATSHKPQATAHKPQSTQLTTNNKQRTTVLTAGQQLLAALDGSLAAEPALFDPDEALSWREGRLRYVNTRLSTVVDEVNRYRKDKIVLADETLGDFRVTTSFRTDQTDQLLSGLAKSYPVTIARNANKITVQARR